MHEINKWILKIDFDFTTDGEKVLSLGLDWEINILGRIDVLVEYVVTLTLDQTSFTLHDKKSEQL